MGISHSTHSAMYMRNNGENYQLELPAAGLTLDDLEITLNGHTVTIGSRKGEEREDSADSHIKQIRRESLRKVTRAIRLPRDAKPEDLVTSLSHGMLTLSVAKVPTPAAPQRNHPGDRSRARCAGCLPKAALAVALVAVISGFICAAPIAVPASFGQAVLIALKGATLAPLLLLEALLVIGFGALRFFFFFSLFSMLFSPFGFASPISYYGRPLWSYYGCRPRPPYYSRAC